MTMVSRLGAAVLLSCACLSGASASGPEASSSPRSGSEDPVGLEHYLRSYLASLSPQEDQTTRVSVMQVRLCGQADRDLLVYVSGRTWCGSGGCTLLAFAATSSGHRPIGRVTVARPPVRLFDTQSKGCRDIGVWVQGGGVQPGYEAALAYDGVSYPGNPTVPPARRMAAGARAETVMPLGAEGRSLYEMKP